MIFFSLIIGWANVFIHYMKNPKSGPVPRGPVPSGPVVKIIVVLLSVFWRIVLFLGDLYDHARHRQFSELLDN